MTFDVLFHCRLLNWEMARVWGAPSFHTSNSPNLSDLFDRKKLFHTLSRCLASSSSGCLGDWLARPASGMPSSRRSCLWRRATGSVWSRISPSAKPVKFSPCPSNFCPSGARKLPGYTLPTRRSDEPATGHCFLNRITAMDAHECPLFNKLLWRLVTSTIFVRC